MKPPIVKITKPDPALVAARDEVAAAIKRAEALAQEAQAKRDALEAHHAAATADAIASGSSLPARSAELVQAEAADNAIDAAVEVLRVRLADAELAIRSDLESKTVDRLAQVVERVEARTDDALARLHLALAEVLSLTPPDVAPVLLQRMHDTARAFAQRNPFGEMFQAAGVRPDSNWLARHCDHIAALPSVERRFNQAVAAIEGSPL